MFYESTISIIVFIIQILQDYLHATANKINMELKTILSQVHCLETHGNILSVILY